MKILLSPILFVFFIGFLASCSEDEVIPNYDDLIGIWEQESYSLHDSGQSLVFGYDYRAYRISRVVDVDDNLISSLSPCIWELNNNVVTIFRSDNVLIGTFTLNSNGQLIPDNSEDFLFEKISDSTPGYF